MKSCMCLFQAIILVVICQKVRSDFDCHNQNTSSGTCQSELFYIYQEAFEERKGPSRYCRCKTVISDLPLPDNTLTYSTFQKICLGRQTELQELWIIDAELAFMDSEIFGHYPNLKLVNLSGNSLRLNFSKKAYKITDLDVSRNGFNLIQSNAFDNLTYLKTLDVSFNRLERINFSLHTLKNLEEIYLNNNHLMKIFYVELNHLQRLRVLNLAHNFLTVIESRLVLGNLQELYLNNNQLKSINADDFLRLPKLKILKINDNLFTGLEDHYSFENIEELHCQNNKMQRVNEKVLGNLTKLKLFNMSNNQVITLETNTFPAQNNLQFVDFSSNGLRYVNEPNFQNFRNVSLLNFSNNSLTQKVISCDNLQNLRQMNILDLSHNQISEIYDCTFSQLENLLKLSLLANQLERIPQSAFSALAKLQGLDLAENRISEIVDGVFDRLVELRKLNVSGNNLTKFDLDNLRNNVKLIEFDIGRNQLKELDLVVLKSKLTALRVLDFDSYLVECDTYGEVLRYFDDNSVVLRSCPSVEKCCSESGFSGKMVAIIVGIVVICLFSVFGLVTVLCKVCRPKENNAIQLLPILTNPK